MSLGHWVHSQKRLLFIVAGLLTVLGIMSLQFVPKTEDPRMPGWFASVSVILPGGAPEQIDEMIAKPLNEKFKVIDELKKVETSTRANVTVLRLEMKDSIKNTTEVWDKVRNAIDEAKHDFPAGTLEPDFQENANNLETILYVVSGDQPLIEIKKTALEMKHRLLSLQGTSKVILHGDPHEEIQANFDSGKLQELSMSHLQILQKLKAANTGIPAGAIEIGEMKVPLLIQSRISDSDQVSKLRLIKGNGDTIELKNVAQIKNVARRLENIAYWNGRPAIFLGIVAQHPIEIIRYGEKVRELVQDFKEEQGNRLSVEEVSFNPDRTEERLKDLGFNLMVGIMTVGLILFFWMGWRVALIVSIFVPVISLVGFFFYSSSGGVLHQISLAAFVISLGQFIDNIIVIVEWMDSKIRQGLSPKEASIMAIDQFKKPMFFATGTNISAFVPMLASSGATAEFTVSIPLVSIITLIAAWVLALFVVPVATSYLLKPSKTSDIPESKKLTQPNFFASLVGKHPLALSMTSLLIMAMSGVGFIFVKKQFFPSADRNQLVISLDLSEGASPSATDKKTQELNQFLSSLPQVQGFASFVGESIPRFYYNVGLGEWGPHTSRILVLTHEKSQNEDVIKQVRQFATENLKGIFLRVENLEQGPPIVAPIEYRVYHESDEKLSQAVEETHELLKRDSGLILTRSTLGEHQSQFKIEFNKDLSERFGLSEDQIAVTLLSSTSGVSVTKYFDNGETRDVRLIGKEIKSLEDLKELPIRSSTFRDLKLKDLATVIEQTGSAVITRYNGERFARVLAWPATGNAANQFTSKYSKSVQEISQRNKTKVEIGGEAEGSEEANLAILRSIPLGLFILILCLLLEFNSIRKMMIILLSVPFVIAGVTPGLLIGNAAFGFMSLLGVLALVGIIVNNSILLIESIDEERESYSDLQSAVVTALQMRARPILMTAVTTIAGLLPMAFEESTLWPPLAWAMISGLIGSTLITLIFVPSLYLLCFAEKSLLPALNWKSIPRTVTPLLMVFAVFLSGTKSEAKIYDFKEALSAIENQSTALKSSKDQLEKIKSLKTAQVRAAFMPKVGLQVDRSQNHETLTQTNGFGTFEYGQSQQTTGGVEVRLPLLNIESMFGDRENMNLLVEAENYRHLSEIQKGKRELIQWLTQYQTAKLSIRSLQRLEKSLLGMESEVSRFYKLGLRGQSDLYQVQLALEENRTTQMQVRHLQQTLKELLQLHLPEFDDLNEESLNELEVQGQTSDVSIERLDLKSLSSLSQAQSAKLRSVRQGHWPTIEAHGSYIYADQGLLDQKDWYKTGVTLKWALFEGGVRSAREAAEASELSRIKNQLVTAQKQVEVEKTKAGQELELIDFKIKEATQSLERARGALNEDSANARRGKVPLRDWLSSEIRYEQKKRDLEVLRLDKIRAKYDYKFALGENI